VFFSASWKDPPSEKSDNLRFPGNDQLIRSLFETQENGSTPEAARRYAMLGALAYSKTPLVYGAPERLLDLGALYGLVADLGLDSDQVLSLLEQMDSIDAEVERSDRRTVIALFQAPLVILRIAVINQLVDQSQAGELVKSLLAHSGDSWRPGDVALRTAAVLSKVAGLLEVQYGPGNPLDLLLKAVAERHEPITFVWNGEPRKIDLEKRRIEQMRTSLEEHYVVPLASVLRALGKLNRGSDEAEGLAADIEPLLTSDTSLDYLSDRYRKAVEHKDVRELQKALDKFRRETGQRSVEKRIEASDALASELAPYLAEALIALVYVKHIKEDDLVIQTDEHFFRKHEFEEKAFTLGSHGPQKMGGTWGQPILVKDKVLGSRIVGSLAGISRPLARLKAEQLRAQSSTRFADSTYPVTQKLAVELVDSSRLTNGALVCAARAMELARRVFAASLVDTELRSFVLAKIDKLCGPRRSWEAKQHLELGKLSDALNLMLPSELFHIGREYWLRHSESGSFREPISTDLDWFFQNNPGCDWHFTHTVESPTRELGFPLTTYFGVDLLLLGNISSVEASTTFNSPHRAAETSCELKLRMADLFWRMGLPSPLFKLVCDKILNRVLPRVGQVDREDWRAVTEQLQSVTEDDVQAVLSDLFDK